MMTANLMDYAGFPRDPGNIDENVGIDQDRFQGATLLIRLPLRRRRT